MEKDKQIYKLLAQKDGVTITANTSNAVTFDEAKEIAINSVLGGVDKAVSFEPVVVLPVTTQERWEDGYINFCPRCGQNVQDFELEQFGEIDCHNCGAVSEVQILNVLDSEDY